MKSEILSDTLDLFGLVLALFCWGWRLALWLPAFEQGASWASPTLTVGADLGDCRWKGWVCRPPPPLSPAEPLIPAGSSTRTELSRAS